MHSQVRPRTAQPAGIGDQPPPLTDPLPLPPEPLPLEPLPLEPLPLEPLLDPEPPLAAPLPLDPLLDPELCDSVVGGGLGLLGGGAGGGPGLGSSHSR